VKAYQVPAGSEATWVTSGRVRIEGGSITYCEVVASVAGLIGFERKAIIRATPPGALYKAASTADNPIDLATGNSSTAAVWFSTSASGTTVELNVSDEISFPSY
jgi:hypothetical protein